MADKSAKAHTHQSNRERPRKASEKKVVYKSVLENPFRIRWPSVPINLQNVIFSHLTSLLDGVAAYHEAQSKASRKRKRGSKNEGSKKRSKKSGPEEDTEDVAMKSVDVSENQSCMVDCNAIALPPKPLVLDHITCGINAVTKRLEAQARQVRRNVIATSEAGDAAQVPLTLVFVCRADADPAILVDHFPPLIAACNSVHTESSEFVRLVPLPKDSEDVIAARMGIRRVSVIALDAQFPRNEEFYTHLNSITPLTAPWLRVEPKATQLVPTHVKQLKTSAPKDMKAAKEARLESRLAAKAKKKKTTPKVTIISS